MTADLKTIVPTISDKLDADLIVYSGEINRTGYEQISKLCLDEKSRTNAVLILCTYGGDPHAGYRIARAIGHHYGSFSVMIPGVCKSAGTLICLGAKELIMGNRSEFGPLDVQVRKKDELFDLGSGLDTIQALSYMQAQAMNAFRSYLIELKADAGLSTKMAAEIASKLATGLFSPIYSQVDPIRLGELQRSIEVAYAYGKRLSDKSANLKPNALNRLVSQYPSHGFVIDRSEAKELFKSVRPPKDEEIDLSAFWYDHDVNSPSASQPFIANFTTTFKGASNAQTGQQPTESVEGSVGGADEVQQAVSKTGRNGDPQSIQDGARGSIRQHK